MRLALRELRRKPLRFAVVGIAMWLLTVLLLFLGGLLDGLYLGSTGVLRAQDAQLITFSQGARTSLIRSRIDSSTRAQVEAVPGVERADGFGVALVGAQVPDETELANTVVVGYEAPTGGVPAPPEPGQAYADRSLAGAGVVVGDVLGLGPRRVPVTVVGWIDDANYLGQGGLWTGPETWREVLASTRPDSTLSSGTFQALAVTVEPGRDVSETAAAIDAATQGSTQTVTKSDAVFSLPGIKEQEATFTQVIGITVGVAGVVVALFFALVTLERTRLYGMLKAVGASTAQIFTGVLTQALVVSGVSFALGAALTYAVGAAIPPGKLPFRIETSRVVTTFVVLLVVSALGSAISLRRVTRIDPASAIG